MCRRVIVEEFLGEMTVRALPRQSGEAIELEGHIDGCLDEAPIGQQINYFLGQGACVPQLQAGRQLKDIFLATEGLNIFSVGALELTAMDGEDQVEPFEGTEF